MTQSSGGTTTGKLGRHMLDTACVGTAFVVESMAETTPLNSANHLIRGWHLLGINRSWTVRLAIGWLRSDKPG